MVDVDLALFVVEALRWTDEDAKALAAVAEAGDPCEAAVVGAVAVIVGTGRTKQKTIIHLYGHKLTVYVNNEHHPRSITLKQFC